MSQRVRSVVVGLIVGVVPLLLLDLARILHDAHVRDGGDTSVWWSIACYAAVGVLVAATVAHGIKDRLAPAIAACLVLVVVLPTVPSRAADMLPALPIVPSTLVQQTVAFVIAGALLYSAARGRKA